MIDTKSISLFCKVVNITESPKYTTYYCNLNNIATYKQIDDYLLKLSIAYHTPIKRIKSNISNFAFRIEKQDISLISFKDHTTDYHTRPSLFTAYLGETDGYTPLYIDFTKNPHLLIAGATGSGKSVALNTIICDMLKTIPQNLLKFIMIDPKMVELSVYENIPNLITPIIHSTDKAKQVFNGLVALMDKRYYELKDKGIKDINEINTNHIFIVIDEYADLVLSDPYLQDDIIKIAQKGRACGIHLIIATQRPTREVLSGLVKTNLTSRIALQTASIRDSINILDHKGAEELRGKGDSLVKLNDRVEEYSTQVAYISKEDIIDATNNIAEPI